MIMLTSLLNLLLALWIPQTLARDLDHEQMYGFIFLCDIDGIGRS